MGLIMLKIWNGNTNCRDFCGLSSNWSYAYPYTVFTNVRFCSLYWDNSSIIFKNLHFETYFWKFVFSGNQNAIVV